MHSKLELSGIDLFGQKYIPYSYCNKFISQICKNIEIYHSISVDFDNLDTNNIIFEIKSQSLQFINGFGSESFVLYPLQINKIINITIHQRLNL